MGGRRGGAVARWGTCRFDRAGCAAAAALGSKRATKRSSRRPLACLAPSRAGSGSIAGRAAADPCRGRLAVVAPRRQRQTLARGRIAARRGALAPPRARPAYPARAFSRARHAYPQVPSLASCRCWRAARRPEHGARRVRQRRLPRSTLTRHQKKNSGRGWSMRSCARLAGLASSVGPDRIPLDARSRADRRGAAHVVLAPVRRRAFSVAHKSDYPAWRATPSRW